MSDKALEWYATKLTSEQKELLLVNISKARRTKSQDNEGSILYYLRTFNSTVSGGATNAYAAIMCIELSSMEGRTIPPAVLKL